MRKLRYILVFVFIQIGIFVCHSSKKTHNKPNVVFIVVDDLGWKDISAYGSDYYQTPNVDRLVADGIKFTDSYAACTVCSPTRASIMTGKYPATLNCTDWIEGWKFPNAKLKVPNWTMYLEPNETTIAEILKKEGYNTAHFGKWHLGEKEENWPENHGFDLNLGGWAKGSPNRNKKLGSKGYFSPYGNPRLEDGPEGEHLTERLASEVCNYIDNHKKDPFYINLWLYNVHTPLQARQDKIDKYTALRDTSKHQQNPTYAAMVEHMDDAVGAVVNKLKAEGLYDNTIVLFTSDNGGLIGRNNKVTNNYPLRSGKGDMYEGGVRIPTVLRLPHNTSGGISINEPVISADYLPTIADMVGANIKKGTSVLDGISWMPLLNGASGLNREAIYWHYPHYHMEGAKPYSAIRKGKWKLIQNYHDDVVELYNLENDISEHFNVIQQNTDIAKDLTQDLNRWKLHVKAQMPLPNPKYDATKEWKR